jgi:hypothetical protein
MVSDWFLSLLIDQGQMADCPRLETLNGLVGKIPSNPLWAELLAAQKREEETAATVKKVRKVGSSTSLKSKRSASGLPRSTSGLKKKVTEKAK